MFQHPCPGVGMPSETLPNSRTHFGGMHDDRVGTYHAVEGLLLLATSLHVASLPKAQVLLQLLQGLELLSASVIEVLHKVIACLQPKRHCWLVLREQEPDDDWCVTALALTLLSAHHLGLGTQH